MVIIIIIDYSLYKFHILYFFTFNKKTIFLDFVSILSINETEDVQGMI